MPEGLDGSTLTVSIAPAVVVSYGFDLASLYQGGALPTGSEAFVVVASRTPTVSTTGVTARTLEDYLLSVPGIPAEVASELRALGNPEQTVPVPIPIDLGSASTVSINGSPGILIGDSTQLGSVVVWTHNGVVEAVAGTLSSSEALGVARSVALTSTSPDVTEAAPGAGEPAVRTVELTKHYGAGDRALGPDHGGAAR